MKRFPFLRDLLFRCRYGFRGAPVSIDGRAFRLDESLRRWRLDCEPAVSEVLRETLRPGDVMLDVGANFGLHTLPAAVWVGDHGKVVAFEPVPANLRLLRKNVRLNQLERVVDIVPRAVSNSPEAFIEMVVPGDDLAVAASLSQSGQKGTTLRVPNLRLDDMSLDTSHLLRLIKLDVEGAEMEVLKGAERLLRKHQPVLLVEIHGYALPSFGATPADLNTFLGRLGYGETRLAGPQSRGEDYYQSVFHPKPR